SREPIRGPMSRAGTESDARTRRVALAAALAFMWPSVVEGIEEARQRRVTASIAAAAIAAGRVALTMRAFSAESRGRMLLWLQGGAAMLVVASLVFRMVDAPSLASPDGVLSLIGYGLIGIAGAIA